MSAKYQKADITEFWVVGTFKRRELGCIALSHLYGTIATTGRCGNMHLSDVLHLRDLAHDCWQLADECVDHHSAGVLRRISEELKEKATDFEIRFAGQLREKFTLAVDDPPVPSSTHN
jgi:hypothetical protein